MELIRKIVVGVNPKDAMAYFVGQRAGSAVVDAIVLDRTENGVNGRRYLIYVSDPKRGTMLWKSVEGMPCLIEYDCDF
jgi:hypothetical protein